MELCSGGGEMRVHIRSKSPVDDCGIMLDGLNIVKEEFNKFRERRIAELNSHPEYVNTVIPATSVRYLELKAGNAGSDLDRAYAEICYYSAATVEEINEEFKEIGRNLK